LRFDWAHWDELFWSCCKSVKKSKCDHGELLMLSEA